MGGDLGDLAGFLVVFELFGVACLRVGKEFLNRSKQLGDGCTDFGGSIVKVNDFLHSRLLGGRWPHASWLHCIAKVQ